jgi:hypothetical protein
MSYILPYISVVAEELSRTLQFYGQRIILDLYVHTGAEFIFYMPCIISNAYHYGIQYKLARYNVS